MHYKKSEVIARKAHQLGCNIDDVSKLDEYLSGRNVKSFTLYDAQSNTGLGYCAEPLLNEYIQEGILREPQARHLCPVHGIGLEVINDTEGKCIDCDTTHFLDDCETEMLYERIGTPDTWSTGEPATTNISHDKERTPWWRSDTFKIAVFSAAIVGVPTLVVTVLLHFNPVSPPTPNLSNLPETVYVTPSPNPTSTATETIVSFPSPGTKLSLTGGSTLQSPDV